ncbi:hypothetical protein DMP11_10130 [Parvibacter caecicola]|nr:hypothetical protein DMP11_10130 [Parvibacter caecicola]
MDAAGAPPDTPSFFCRQNTTGAPAAASRHCCSSFCTSGFCRALAAKALEASTSIISTPLSASSTGRVLKNSTAWAGLAFLMEAMAFCHMRCRVAGFFSTSTSPSTMAPLQEAANGVEAA